MMTTWGKNGMAISSQRAVTVPTMVEATSFAHRDDRYGDRDNGHVPYTYGRGFDLVSLVCCWPIGRDRALSRQGKTGYVLLVRIDRTFSSPRGKATGAASPSSGVATVMVEDRDAMLRHRDDGRGRRGDDATIHPSMPRRRDLTCKKREHKKKARVRQELFYSLGMINKGSRVARDENDSSNATRAFVFQHDPSRRISVTMVCRFCRRCRASTGHPVWLH
jgi:hypothetical protein